MQHRVWTYELGRWRALAADWVERGIAGAYVIDGLSPEEDPDECDLEIAFTDPQALGRVRFESFLADTRCIERPSEELDRAVAEEIELLKAYIDGQLEDLRRNFNPKIARLRKRTKIMMYPQVFDALRTDNEDSE